jgi:hypothetical protein
MRNGLIMEKNIAEMKSTSTSRVSLWIDSRFMVCRPSSVLELRNQLFPMMVKNAWPVWMVPKKKDFI